MVLATRFPRSGSRPWPVRVVSAGFSLSARHRHAGARQCRHAIVFRADVQGWIGLLDGKLGLNGAISMGPAKAVPAAGDHRP